MEKRKNAHAVALGRKGGKRRMITMSAEQRSAVARLGALAMWRNKRAQALPPQAAQ